MIDWEELINAEEESELKKIKLFLFQENMRLENEKKTLKEDRERLVKLQDDFMRDRVKLRDELNDLNRKTLLERQRLKQENLFFDKKMAILQDGFRSLEADRKKLEQERRELENSRLLGSGPEYFNEDDYDEIARLLFASVTNPIGLRKRYRDLVKIFHPDNLFGDEQLSQAINREFQKRRDS